MDEIEQCMSHEHFGIFVTLLYWPSQKFRNVNQREAKHGEMNSQRIRHDPKITDKFIEVKTKYPPLIVREQM